MVRGLTLTLTVSPDDSPVDGMGWRCTDGAAERLLSHPALFRAFSIVKRSLAGDIQQIGVERGARLLRLFPGRERWVLGCS